MKTTTVKKALATSALLALTASFAMANVITATPVGGNSLDITADDLAHATPFYFTKFDTSLGTLVSAEVSVTGYNHGTFSITNNSTHVQTLSQGQNELYFYDSTDTLIGRSTTNMTTDPALGSSQARISVGATKSFTLDGASNPYVPMSFSTDNADFALNYFYGGAGNVEFKMHHEQQFDTTPSFSGSQVTADWTPVDSHSTVTVTYTYDPFVAVPEPGQIAASCLVLLGMGGFAARRRLARK